MELDKKLKELQFLHGEKIKKIEMEQVDGGFQASIFFSHRRMEWNLFSSIAEEMRRHYSMEYVAVLIYLSAWNGVFSLDLDVRIKR